MSEHRATISWKATDAPFTYDTFDRGHLIGLAQDLSVNASSAPEYKGDATRTNPEELLVASAASCHMLTFLSIAARKRLTVLSYRDAATGTLELNEEKKLAVTRIVLRPVVAFAGTQPSPEELAKLHDTAHRNCFIASSIRASVTVEPTAPSEPA